ncbi:MAG: hypothetical protein ABJL99_07900 [Aliishimia sp.]
MQNLNIETLKKIALAGLIGEIVFEAYSWLLSPVIFGPILEPAKLVTAVVAKVSGIMLPYSLAFIIHFLIGTIFFALLVYVANGILRKGYVLAGLVTGLVLWFVAQGMLAPFIGRPFMMSFGAYTQSSFVAHTGMMIVIGLVLSKLLADQAAKA